MIKEALIRVMNHEDLSFQEAEEVMDEIMAGSASNVQLGSFLTAMNMKGETVEEITAFACCMRKHALEMPHVRGALEIVGTGGDKSNSFNVSTTSSFVIAAAGVPVAKHGNRAASSRCGAADVLEQLGVNIGMTPPLCIRALNEVGITFLFAQQYHQAMGHVAPVRKELGVRTVFNLLGPLTNPMSVNNQLMGVYDGSMIEPLARVMMNLGVDNGMVVHGHDGMDEITLCDKSSICEIGNGCIRSYELNPESYGFALCSRNDITGGAVSENAKILREVLQGEKGPRRDIVILNSAAALYVARRCSDIREGIALANKAIDTGMALQKLESLVDFSNQVSP